MVTCLTELFIWSLKQNINIPGQYTKIVVNIYASYLNARWQKIQCSYMRILSQKKMQKQPHDQTYRNDLIV